MNDLAEKVLYCAQMMRLVRWICDLAGDSYLKRLIGRMLFVYLDSFVELGRQLKNRLRAEGHDIREAEATLSSMADERDRFFGVIRDRLTAHRQEMLLVVIIERWREIEDYSLLVLADDAESTYSRLAACDASLPAFATPLDVGDAVLCDYLVESLQTTSIPNRLGMDTFALGRGDVLATLPTGDLQRCAARITSVLDVIKATTVLLRSLPQTELTERLLKSLLVVETCNLMDCLYPPDSPNPPAALDLLTIVKDAVHMDASELEAGQAVRDRTLEQRLREVRNKVGAHIDDEGAMPLRNLLTMLDGVALEELEAVHLPATIAFRRCCHVNVNLRVFLAHNLPLPVPLATQQAEGNIA